MENVGRYSCNEKDCVLLIYEALMKAINRNVFVLLMGLAWSASASDRYVSLDGTNDASNGYNTWAGAATQIQWAVAAAGAGETVLVSNGTYYLTNQVTVGNVKVRSWPDGISGRDTTIVNGNYPEYTNRCFLLNNASALVEGFTLSNSCSSGIAQGSAVTITAGTLRNCLVTGNITTDATHSAGVYVTGANSVITNCRVETNIGNQYGAGVYMTASSKLLNSHVVGNRVTSGSYGRGAGVHMDGGSVVDGCHIAGNMVTNGTTAFGAGIFSDGGTIRNCLITSNSAYSGAVYFRGVTAIENCTVVSNFSGYQPGIVLNAASACTIRNVIAWRNRYSAVLDIDIWDQKSATVPTYYTNCAFGLAYDAAAPAAKPWRGTGNIDLSIINPGFVDAQAGNYRLQASSPCVNAGINQSWMANSINLDGQSRIDNFSGIVDIGCYEYLPPGIVFRVR
jgi:hypothetical protein